MVFKESLKGVSRMLFQESFMGFKQCLIVCFKVVSRNIEGSFKRISKKVKDCFKEI